MAAVLLRPPRALHPSTQLLCKPSVHPQSLHLLKQRARFGDVAAPLFQARRRHPERDCIHVAFDACCIGQPRRVGMPCSPNRRSAGAAQHRQSVDSGGGAASARCRQASSLPGGCPAPLPPQPHPAPPMQPPPHDPQNPSPQSAPPTLPLLQLPQHEVQLPEGGEASDALCQQLPLLRRLPRLPLHHGALHPHPGGGGGGVLARLCQDEAAGHEAG